MTDTSIIRGGLVLDAATYLGAADILVRDGRIVEVGAPGMAAPEGAAVIDASHRLLHPGLVNAHTHGHGNLGKSMGDGWTLELLLAANPWIGGMVSAAEKRLAATIGAAEMVLKGCTAAYDLFVENPGPTVDGIDAVAEGYRSVGMRAVIAPMVADMTLYEAVPGLGALVPAQPTLPAWEETVAGLRAVLQAWRWDRDWVRPAVAPTIPIHCRDEFLVACRDLAEAFGVGVHSHVAESKVQAVVGAARYGRSLAAHLDGLGVIGPRFTAAHGVWLDGEDWKILAGHGASVAHNPASNMRLGNGVADFAGMLRAGVNVGIGTDAATCSDNLNMYGAMHFAAAGSHARGPDPRFWVRNGEVLAAATVGSARALGMDHIGRIAAGFAADIVFLDMEKPTLMPLNDPVNQVVMGEDGTSVDAVMIGGRFVVREGRLLTVDLRKLAREAAAARDAMRERNAGKRANFECVAAVVADFCPALASQAWHINRYCGC